MYRGHATIFLLLVFSILSGQIVADVKIQGNKKTNSNFLKKIIRLKPGMKLDSTLIEKDITRLKRLPAVAHAYYQVFEANGNNEYNVFYSIEENFTIIPFANVYTSNNDEFAFRVGVQEFNFFRKKHYPRWFLPIRCV